MKIIKKILLILLISFTIFISVLTYQGYSMYKEAINEMSIKDMIGKVKEDTDTYTYIEDIPEDYVNAVIAIEDRRFYNHHGVDIISISRAIVTNIKELSYAEGGSTITQQIAKNVYFTQEKIMIRKIAEAFMALKIEEVCSKDEIFELYVNTSYFGDRYYCIADATYGYFEKEPKDMTLYESTMLAGIPNAPSVYAPTKNIDLAKQRQSQVISQMVKYGYLTQEEADNITE